MLACRGVLEEGGSHSESVTSTAYASTAATAALIPTAIRRNPSIQIRAIRASRGAARSPLNSPRVAIPPYRSGQFRAAALLQSDGTGKLKASQSLHADQGNFEVVACLSVGATTASSQSLHTDQGNSETDAALGRTASPDPGRNPSIQSRQEQAPSWRVHTFSCPVGHDKSGICWPAVPSWLLANF